MADGLFEVWGTSPTDIWAAGSSGLTIHWDGATWSKVDGGTTNYRFGIWGSAANDVWAVGQTGSVTRFDGRVWSPITDAGYAQYEDVSGSAANNVWAVGSFSRADTSGRLIGRWDGAQWSVCRTKKGALSGVWVSPAGTPWAVGEGIERLAPPSECEPP